MRPEAEGYLKFRSDQTEVLAQNSIMAEEQQYFVENVSEMF